MNRHRKLKILIFNNVVDFTNEVISKVLGYDSDKSTKPADK